MIFGCLHLMQAAVCFGHFRFGLVCVCGCWFAGLLSFAFSFVFPYSPCIIQLPRLCTGSVFAAHLYEDG
jgi:hypothetical protein